MDKVLSVIALLRPEGEVVSREVNYSSDFFGFIKTLDYTSINRLVRQEEDEIMYWDSFEEFEDHYNIMKYEKRMGDVVLFDEKKMEDHLKLLVL